MNLNPEQKEFRLGHLKTLSVSIEKLKKQLETVEKDDKELGLPNIPMGKNTHKIGKDGFANNKTKIGVRPPIIGSRLEASSFFRAMNIRIKPIENVPPATMEIQNCDQPGQTSCSLKRKAIGIANIIKTAPSAAM